MLTRRELIRDIAYVTAGIVVGPAIFSSVAEAAQRKTLGNFLILDMNGKPRNYGEEGNPICTEPNVYKCKSGIGNYLSLSGKPALLVFGAYWCSPCEAQMDIIEQVHKTYQRIQVVGLNSFDTKDESLEDAIKQTKEKIAEKGVTYPNLMMKLGDLTILSDVASGMPIPVNVLVDVPSMEIIYVIGRVYAKDEEKKLQEGIDKFLATKK